MGNMMMFDDEQHCLTDYDKLKAFFACRCKYIVEARMFSGAADVSRALHCTAIDTDQVLPCTV